MVLGLSSSSSGSSSTSKTPSRQESHHLLQPHLLHPTVSEIQTRERGDGISSDTSPVPVSISVDDRSWQPDETQANKIPILVLGVKEGTSAVLLQSGLDENWWADSMECYTYLRNVQDLLSDGKTPYERRFGETIYRTDHSVWFTG